MITVLNPRLIGEQELKDDEVELLLRLHTARQELFAAMDKMDPSSEDDISLLRTYVILLESLEFNMQRVWKFPLDRNRHNWWYKAPHCICKNTVEGYKKVGFRERIINESCPLHGDTE